MAKNKNGKPENAFPAAYYKSKGQRFPLYHQGPSHAPYPAYLVLDCRELLASAVVGGKVPREGGVACLPIPPELSVDEIDHIVDLSLPVLVELQDLRPDLWPAALREFGRRVSQLLPDAVRQQTRVIYSDVGKWICDSSCAGLAWWYGEPASSLEDAARRLLSDENDRSYWADELAGVDALAQALREHWEDLTLYWGAGDEPVPAWITEILKRARPADV